MRKIMNWSAKRSGASMTVDGVDAATGRPVKLTNVIGIEVWRIGSGFGTPGVRAVDSIGEEVELVVSADA